MAYKTARLNAETYDDLLRVKKPGESFSLTCHRKLLKQKSLFPSAAFQHDFVRHPKSVD